MSDPADLSVNDPDPFASGADALRVEGLGSANGSTDASAASSPAGTNGTASVNSAGAVAAEVIDLRDAGTTRVRVAKDNNPFGALSKQERMRLIVRVLCEIVAYGELEEGEGEQAVLEPDAGADAPPAPELPISNN